MTKHLFGIVVTPHGTAANNRGDTDSGNISTLQKLLWNGDVHSTVSAEAIRWAIRYALQAKALPNNRRWNDILNRHEWQDPLFTKGPKEFVDDDLLGFMSARAAERDASQPEEETDTPAPRRRPRGTIDTRRARLEFTRAVSLTPWPGDITFNAASIGATPSASRTGRDPVPYATEYHATRYQYGFALTPEALAEPARALYALDAIVTLAEVAGNHARFLYDFSPDSIVLRWTDDAAPRMLYGFSLDANGAPGLPDVVRKVHAGDIDGNELVVGGAVAATADGTALREAGATVVGGVKAAANEMTRRVRESLGL